MRNLPTFISTRISLLIIALVISPAVILAQSEVEKDSINNIDELEQAIESILTRTKTPAAGIIMISGDSTIWEASIGVSNKENNTPANKHTMFRIGSTSKMFVALAVLKLQEEGKLSLKDKVRDLVPEIEFQNKWSDTHPILVEHLLEHTTGWDDFHLVEYAEQDPTPMTLKEGLDFHPHSRISRWIPGTRMSYCNSGPPVAAYIVEKITGQEFESYIQQHFFEPMGVVDMTYRFSEAYQEKGATLYSGGTPQPYWHILMRPSGAINASPTDMSKMVKFFVNRGKIDSTQVVSTSSLDRMEQSLTTIGAKKNMDVGYGLHNYTVAYGGYNFHGHNGGVNGGLNDFAYLPELKIGYNISINSDKGGALNDISAIVKDYLLGENKKVPLLPQKETLDNSVDGIYVQKNPRNQMLHFIGKLTEFEKLWVNGDTLYRKAWFDNNTAKFISTGSGRYVSVQTGNVSLVEAEDPLLGKAIQSGSVVKQKISNFKAYGQIGITFLWSLFNMVGLILGFIWLIRYLMGLIEQGPSTQIRFWPIIASLALTTAIVFFFIGTTDPFTLLGKVCFTSIMIALGTLLYGIISIYAIYYILKHRALKMARFTYVFSFCLATLNVIAALYLFSQGALPLLTWS